MRIFLSYPSVQRATAERLAHALEAEGHEVFFDRHDLDPGEAFHARIRAAIDSAEAMVFLLTPDSVRAGSYALTELELARARWPRPSGHVLPVMLAPTPVADLPAYLSTVTILQPRGELVAESVAAVARLRPVGARSWQRWAIGGGLAALTIAGTGVLVHRQLQADAAREARAEAELRDLAEARAASELCLGGGHAVALARLDQLAQRASMPVPAGVLDLREDCAMFWLRDMRATSGKTTFGEQVAVAQPVLLQGLARSQGQRAADLRAHIGWGEYLRGRDGTPGVDPAAHWRRALADEADNVYAQAMWGRQLLDRPGGLAEARERFGKALATKRHRLFVRGLQLGGSVGGSEDLQAYALVVVDEMPRGNEKLLDLHRDRLWSRLFAQRIFDDDYRARLYAALPGPELLRTFQWIFPPATVPEDRRLSWRFVLATLQLAAGEASAARLALQALARELRAADAPGSLLRAVERELGRLPSPAAGSSTGR
jgi:TIR domain